MTDREHFIEDIAETALYGGIDYWADAADVGEYGSRDRCAIRDRKTGDAYRLGSAIRSGLAKAGDPGVEMNPEIRRWIVTSDRANDGGSIDAAAADVIVQLGCFGEIVYG